MTGLITAPRNHCTAHALDCTGACLRARELTRSCRVINYYSLLLVVNKSNLGARDASISCRLNGITVSLCSLFLQRPVTGTEGGVEVGENVSATAAIFSRESLVAPTGSFGRRQVAAVRHANSLISSLSAPLTN